MEEQQKDDPVPGQDCGREAKRSRICSVCRATSETFHLNYGVSTCFSCRAFFRRVVAKGSDPSELKCKAKAPEEKGKCEVDFEKKASRCKSCRFQKCLRVSIFYIQSLYTYCIRVYKAFRFVVLELESISIYMLSLIHI